GVGVASVGTSAVKSAAWLGERRRKAAQIDNAIAFHIVKAQSYRLEFSVAPPGYYIFCLFNRGSSQALVRPPVVAAVFMLIFTGKSTGFCLASRLYHLYHLLFWPDCGIVGRRERSDQLALDAA